MRFKTWLVVAAIVAAGGTFAKDLPPWTLRDPGKTYAAKTRQINFKDYRSIGIEYSVPCRIRYVDPYFGYLDDATYYRLGKMPFQSNCYESSAPDLYAGAPVRYDETRKIWIRDIVPEIKMWGPNLRHDEVLAIDRSIRVYPLSGADWAGFAFTKEAWTGDVAGRTRRLSFCLFHGPVALCGHGDVGLQSDGVKGDLTPYVLKILRSIEFVNDELPVVVPAAVDSASMPASR